MTTHPVLVLAAGLALILAALGLLMFWRLARHSTQPLLSVGKASAASLEVSYRPLRRLFDEADFDFLATQPGYHPAISRRLRARRVAVFRGYLRRMSADFNRLHGMLRLLALECPQDRPDLGRFLFEQRVIFAFRMAQVRVRLALFGVGIRPVHVNALTEAIERLRSTARALSFVPHPADASAA